MEVHQHSHISADPGPSTDSGHRALRKKWTHYFWEFLMLFLAVFCGFIAENFREHKVEHSREKQYMQSFIYDLQNDTFNLNEGFPRKDQRIIAIDSVFLFFENNPSGETIPGYVHRNLQRTLWDRHYRRNSTTNDQLKNAGGMRLIGKKNVADSIAAYDLKWVRADYRKDAYFTSQEKGKDLLTKIIKPQNLLAEYRLNNGMSVTASHNDTTPVHIDRSNLDQFLAFLIYVKISTRQDKRDYQDIEQSAEKLIELIKKEYNIH